MVDVVNVQEAKTHLSRLLKRVERGEEILLGRAGTPIARLVPLQPVPRKLGLLKDRITIGEDFDDPLPPELLDAFEHPA